MIWRLADSAPRRPVKTSIREFFKVFRKNLFLIHRKAHEKLRNVQNNLTKKPRNAQNKPNKLIKKSLKTN
jgi:hypothetical protein